MIVYYDYDLQLKMQDPLLFDYVQMFLIQEFMLDITNSHLAFLSR